MIDLTPVDVRKKKGDFRRSMRGYDAPVVDQFLDLVADRMEELARGNVSLTDRVAALETMVADYKEREKALTEALVTAQEVREEVRKQAERAADLLRREAEADADRLRSDAVAALEREEDALRQLRARRAQFLRSYRRFLERELSELEVIDGALEQDESASRDRADAIRAAREGTLRRWELLESQAERAGEDEGRQGSGPTEAAPVLAEAGPDADESAGDTDAGAATRPPERDLFGAEVTAEAVTLETNARDADARDADARDADVTTSETGAPESEVQVTAAEVDMPAPEPEKTSAASGVLAETETPADEAPEATAAPEPVEPDEPEDGGVAADEAGERQEPGAKPESKSNDEPDWLSSLMDERP